MNNLSTKLKNQYTLISQFYIIFIKFTNIGKSSKLVYNLLLICVNFRFVHFYLCIIYYVLLYNILTSLLYRISATSVSLTCKLLAFC